MIIIEFATEDQTKRAYALLDGQIVKTAQYDLFTKDHIKLAAHLLARLTVKRVAPRVLQLDKRGDHDIDLAPIRQVLLYSLQTDIIKIVEIDELAYGDTTETRPQKANG